MQNGFMVPNIELDDNTNKEIETLKIVKQYTNKKQEWTERHSLLCKHKRLPKTNLIMCWKYCYN